MGRRHTQTKANRKNQAFSTHYLWLFDDPSERLMISSLKSLYIKNILKYNGISIISSIILS